MASFIATPAGIRHAAPAGRHLALDRHKAALQIQITRVKLQAAGANHALCFKHQARLQFNAVLQRPHPREELQHDLEHPLAQARGVDRDVFDKILLRQLVDLLGLILKIRTFELHALQHPKLAARLIRRCQHHQACSVAGVAGVIANPHPLIGKWPQGKRLEVISPCIPAIHMAAHQLGQGKDGKALIHKPAHQQVVPLLIAVFKAQLIQIKQITATGRRIQHRHNLAPDLVLTRKTAGQPVMAQVQLNAVSLAALAVDAVTAPECIRLVLQTAGRAEVRLAPLLVHCHAAGHLVELIERLCPEELVKVKITVVALCRAGIGAQKVQRRPVGQHDRIATQFNAQNLFHKSQDVAPENMRLRLAR